MLRVTAQQFWISDSGLVSRYLVMATLALSKTKKGCLPSVQLVTQMRIATPQQTVREENWLLRSDQMTIVALEAREITSGVSVDANDVQSERP